MKKSHFILFWGLNFLLNIGCSTDSPCPKSNPFTGTVNKYYVDGFTKILPYSGIDTLTFYNDSNIYTTCVGTGKNISWNKNITTIVSGGNPDCGNYRYDSSYSQQVSYSFVSDKLKLSLTYNVQLVDYSNFPDTYWLNFQINNSYPIQQPLWVDFTDYTNKFSYDNLTIGGKVYFNVFSVNSDQILFNKSYGILSVRINNTLWIRKI